jgi:hypothetical protein
MTNQSDQSPVEFELAGAPFKAIQGRFEGRFHPIPKDLWLAIIGFHRQISIDHNAESVSYHHWHKASGEYHSLIPFQSSTKSGLRVSVDWTDKRNEKLLDEYAQRFGEDFFPACSIHTHVDIGAFESGVDASDESEQEGWHITLGKLISHEKYDLDFRMRLPRSKKLKQIVDTSRKFQLGPNHFFTDKGDWIETSPGTTDFHKFIERVELSWR